ncbi:hypothetical protein D5301_08655 [Stenotrophomonas sp. MH181796]|uniref:hypothetical protein n=1 Tax=Stenotrophomonas sp. MH181796 TaxID=2339228 RepID=UPI00129C2F70|nr:hypothetical protein [Stenotrophomonas sp. MH181796]MRI42296.1 hypothetical protein [Stenotrophomonas sp. MH181796]
MFDDIVKGIREYVSDRFMSPLGASLTVSWCLWNYKALLIVLSGESAIRKIHLLHLVYQDNAYSAVHLAAGPLATAAFYILAFPYPSNWVYSYSLRRRKEALDLKREIDNQTVLTHEESRALRAQFEEMDLEHRSATLRLNSRIDTLKEQLKQAIDERDGALKKLNDVHVTAADPVMDEEHGGVQEIVLSKLQWRAIDVLGRSGNQVSISTLAGPLELGAAAVGLLLRDLEEMGLVYLEYDYQTDAPEFAGLTDVGLRLFMSNI